MAHHDPPTGELSATWRWLQGEQLDLRSRLIDLPPGPERDEIVARFQANKAAIAAIERGEEPDLPPRPIDDASSDVDDDPLHRPGDDDDLDELDDLDGIGSGRAGPVGLLIAVAAVLIVIALSATALGRLSGTDGDRATQVAGAGSGTAPSLRSTSGDLRVELERLRERLIELDLVAIVAEVRAETIVVEGPVATERERREVLDAARATVGFADIDTSGVRLAVQSLPALVPGP